MLRYNPNQTESGKAFEYGIASQSANLLNAELTDNVPMQNARRAYDRFPADEQGRIDMAADEAITFLQGFEPRLGVATSVRLQADNAGRVGDVRDVVIQTEQGEVGISAKHRNTSLKHSRLSGTLDFGNSWYGIPCSDDYWNLVRPIFRDLRSRRQAGELWRELPNKWDDYYVPVLGAFVEEVRQYANLTDMMQYLLAGAHDYYKVVKENGTVTLQSFNVNNTLGWGQRVPMPDELIRIAVQPNARNTAIMVANNGWQLSFRLHNASSRIEASLKFDVKLIGTPERLTRQTIRYE